jgi:hypothetical protein
MVTDEGPEIIFNLWYLKDEDGVIGSLRARAYITAGREEDKIALLKTSADVDYLIAKAFPIPERFHAQVRVGDESHVLPCVFEQSLPVVGCPFPLYEDAIRQLESELPGQTKLPVKKTPLVCLTPLVMRPDGAIEPEYSGTENLSLW